MTDEADAAQRLEEGERAAAIGRRRRTRIARTCMRCGDDIPADDLAVDPDAMECAAHGGR